MTLNKHNARNYPLNSLGMLGDVLKKLRETASYHRSLIAEDQSNEDEIVKFYDRENPDFYFKVTYEPQEYGFYQSQHSAYELVKSYYPSDEDTHRHNKAITSHMLIDDEFKGWITLLISYNSAISQFDPQDAIQKKYEDEFVEEIKILDADAETMPFDDDRQKKIYDFLTYVEMAIDTIKNPSDTITNLKKDIIEFKEEIPSLTKKQVVEKGGYLYGLFKKLNPIVRAVIIKEGIKFGLKRIADGSALRLIQNLEDFVLPK
jgi:hypothetical protein